MAYAALDIDDSSTGLGVPGGVAPVLSDLPSDESLAAYLRMTLDAAGLVPVTAKGDEARVSAAWAPTGSGANVRVHFSSMRRIGPAANFQGDTRRLAGVLEIVASGPDTAVLDEIRNGVRTDLGAKSRDGTIGVFGLRPLSYTSEVFGTIATGEHTATLTFDAIASGGRRLSGY